MTKTKLFIERICVAILVCIVSAVTLFATIVCVGKMLPCNGWYFIGAALSFAATLMLSMLALRIMCVAIWDRFPKTRKHIKKMFEEEIASV